MQVCDLMVMSVVSSLYPERVRISSVLASFVTLGSVLPALYAAVSVSQGEEE